MKEKHENKVEIESVDGKAVISLIEYMYNGSIDIDNQNVFELLAAADYFQLMDVKQYCFQYVQSKVTIDNWLYTLKAVNLYVGDESKDQIYQHISAHFNEIVQTDDINMLSHFNLRSLIESCDRTIALETTLCQIIVNWIKNNVEARKQEFLDLFKLVKVDQLLYEFIKNLLEEDFIKANQGCHELLVTTFLRIFKYERNENEKSKIISAGGKYTLSKVTEVYSMHDCNLTDYPDFPVNMACHLSLRGNHDCIYCVGKTDNDY